jgi:hypothetical protein
MTQMLSRLKMSDHLKRSALQSSTKTWDHRYQEVLERDGRVFYVDYSTEELDWELRRAQASSLYIHLFDE